MCLLYFYYYLWEEFVLITLKGYLILITEKESMQMYCDLMSEGHEKGINKNLSFFCPNLSPSPPFQIKRKVSVVFDCNDDIKDIVSICKEFWFVLIMMYVLCNC